MITTIIFDLGGIVVTEAGNLIQEGMALYLAIPQTELAKFTMPLKARLTTGEMTLHDLYDSLAKSKGLSLTADDMLNRHFELYKQHLIEDDANLKEIYNNCKSGKLLCGEDKQNCKKIN